MKYKAIVISRGLHPPWNMGEVVLARNFTKILAELYDEISVFSTADKARGSYEEMDVKPPFGIKFYLDEERLKIAFLGELNNNSHVDVHLINTSLVKFLNVARKARRVYFYQFAYNIYNDPKLILRSIVALPLTYLNNVKIITTSPCSYIRFHNFFRRNYYYVPTPIDPPLLNERLNLDEEINNKLKIFYLGHGSYLRFPYDKVFKAILRLKKESNNIELNLYISKQGYANYEEFTAGLEKMIKILNLETVVKVHLKNLPEHEKWNIIRENHVLLFPSLTNSAIDLPLVVLEAMFMGKCIIAASTQSIPYLLGRSRGIIVDQRNLEDNVYKALRILEDDRMLLKEYGMSAKRWVAKIHSMNSIYNRVKKILDEP